MDDLKNDLDLITEFICSFGTAYYRRRKGNTREAQDFGQYFVTIFLEKYRKKEKLETDWPCRNDRYFFLNFLGRYNDNRQIV
ncbi:hypothetical protein K8T06_11690, partial [bacterium]|nr:hypothetical protein [bacterium]